MKVLLLSAYAARSHDHWQQAVEAMFPDWGWQSLTLPPRHFSWRIRGNPLYWSQAQRPLLEAGHDLLLATSMVDLATLRGLVPALCRLPTLLYFHENQFEYPAGRQRHSPVEAQMVSLYAALAADRLAFNSAFNRDTFLAGVDALLTRLPDKVPAGIVSQLAARATVLPVPVATPAVAVDQPGPWSGGMAYPDRPLRLLWVGRFEHDKGGDRLLRLLQQLDVAGTDYQLAVVGQQFRKSPPVFDHLAEAYRSRLVRFGNLPARSELLALMAGADVVVSTALHEFQGLAVMEAVARGCLPVVPDRLVYPEIYPRDFRYQSLLHDPGQEAKSAAALIRALAARLAAGTVAAPVVSAWGTGALRERYRQELEALLVPAGGADSAG